MHVMVKICGLMTATAIDSAIEAGADAIGFVFAESPRQVTVAQATALAGAIPPGIARVAVMRHPTAAQWAEVETLFRPDWLQTDAEDFAAIELQSAARCIPVYRDTANPDAGAPDKTCLEKNLANAGQIILFEAEQSGVGQRADWGRAAELAKKHRIILAGGLDSDNIGDAIRQVRPWGVDVSSGVEQRRGYKDPARIAAFVRAVREAESANGN